MAENRYISRIKLSLSPGKSSYWSCLPALARLARMDFLPLSAPVTFWVGENGSGKSTLLEAVAVASGFNPEGGTKNFSFSTQATHSNLHEFLTLSKSAWPKDGFFLRAESFYNAASYIDELDALPAASPAVSASYGGKSLHRQSHGESFLSLVAHRFGGRGLYLLDEPEAALSPAGLLTFMVHMHRLAQAGSQFIIATHSPVLMTYPGAEILFFGGGASPRFLPGNRALQADFAASAGPGKNAFPFIGRSAAAFR